MSTDFFVHVVESPSSDDLLDGHLEGRVLYQALCASRIDASYMVAATKEAFWKAIGERLLDRIGLDGFQRWPILHLSAHGSPSGLQLTNSDPLKWSELTNYLRKVNRLLNGTLILAVSSCFGSHAVQEALSGDQPYYAIVGPSQAVPLSDLAIGFSSFYHVLSKTWNLSKAHKAMVAAADNTEFLLFFTEEARRDYSEWRLRRMVKSYLDTLSKQGLPAPPPEPPEEHS